MFLQRLQRLFKADAHALLDKIEDPGILLKQSIRDMQQLIDEEKLLLNRLNSEKQLLKEQITQHEGLINSNNEEVSLCFKNKHEQLIKPLLASKIGLEKKLQQLQNKQLCLHHKTETHQTLLTEHITKIDEIKYKAGLFNHDSDNQCNKNNNGYKPHVIQPGDPYSATENEIEIAFLKAQQLFEQEKSHAS